MRPGERNKSGIGLAEILVATAMAAAIGVPILSNLAMSVQETAVSEDYMFAQCLAERYLAETLLIPLDEIAKRIPLTIEIKGVEPVDTPRTDPFPAYRANLVGPESFRGVLSVNTLAKELYQYRVIITWPVKPGSPEMRHLVLMRLRTPSDLGMRVRHKDDPDLHIKLLKEN